MNHDGAEARAVEHLESVALGDPDLVGRFIGKRGRNIQRLTVETGVRIQVDQRSKHGATVQLSGSMASVLAAKERIQEEIEQLKTLQSAPRGAVQRFSRLVSLLASSFCFYVVLVSLIV